jgi:hypothetical protein
MSNVLHFVAVFLALSTILVAYQLFRLTIELRRLTLRVRQRYSSFLKKLSMFQQRLTRIQERMSSMSPEGTSAMDELQQLIGTQSKLAEELKQWAESKDTGSLEKADRMLSEELYGPDDSVPISESGVVRSKIDWWESRVETLLQLAGNDLAAAAAKSRQRALSQRRDRPSTPDSLKGAGILAAETDSESRESD